MGFKLKSGNTTSFKLMGGTDKSPAKDMKTGSYKQSFESPAKQDLQSKLKEQGKHYKKTTKEIIDTPRRKNEFPKKEDIQKQADYTSTQANIKPNEWNDPYTKRDKYGNKIKEKSPGKNMKKSPAYQKQNKGGESQDQNKILDNRGNYVGNWVNNKKVMFNDKPVKDLQELKVNKDSETSITGIKWPKKKKSVAKQTSDTFADGTNKSDRDKFNDTETAIEQRKADRDDNQKPPYWFKINGEFKTHAEYKAYENKPGNMEGGGKQTNHPDAMGYKAKHKANRAKLKTK